MQPDWVSAIAQSIAAIFTAGTLAVAVVVLRVEQKERQRAEIRGVRCYLELRQKTDNSDAPVLVLHLDNGSDELIYGVRASVSSPASMITKLHVAEHQIMEPKEEITVGTEIEHDNNWTTNSELLFRTKTEMTFRDGRGNRWLRGSDGQLEKIHMPRWYTPWRVPPRLAMPDDTPWWNIGTHWKYRKEDADSRLLNNEKPQWWYLVARLQYRRYTANRFKRRID